MDTRHFHKALFDAARRLIPEKSTVVCAVSGGPDSMALLHGLVRVNETRKCGWQLSIAHLDHHLPTNSTEITAFVREQAAGLELPLYEDAIDVPALSRETGESIEEAGRKARYAFLRRAAEQFEAKYVALAHQADDQSETVLHRVLRGTGLRGLAGIPERRPLARGCKVEIVRPILNIRRRQILAYLERRRIPWMHDQSNDDVTVATRNHVRNELLPTIRERINPGVEAALLRLSRQAREASDLIRRAAAAIFDEAASIDDSRGVQLRVDLLSATPPIIVAETILMAFARLGAPMKSIGAERMDAIIAALGPGIEFRTVQLANGFIVERRGRHLDIRPASSSTCVHQPPPVGAAEALQT